MASATLIIGHWSSKCGACGRGADPYETYHMTALGYFPTDTLPDDPCRRGCGAQFTSIGAEYGPDERAVVQAMRPDLPWSKVS